MTTEHGEGCMPAAAIHNNVLYVSRREDLCIRQESCHAYISIYRICKLSRNGFANPVGTDLQTQ